MNGPLSTLDGALSWGRQRGCHNRAFGPAIYVPGSDVASRAQHFVDIDLAGFGIGFEGDWTVESKTGQHDWAFAQQTFNGIPVEGGKMCDQVVGRSAHHVGSRLVWSRA